MKELLSLIGCVVFATSNAQIISTVAGNGTGAYSGDNGQATSAELYLPYRVAFDASGNMYVADTQNSRIRKVNSSGVITTFAGTGLAAFNGDNIQAASAALYTPTGLTFDAAGNMYIDDEDNMRIRKVNTSGVITTVAGNGTGGFSGDNGAATSAELLRPYEVAVDASGNMYIADTQNSRIRKVSNSGIITTIAGNGTAGFGGDGGPATAAQINNPSGLALDAAGNLYIADTYNNRVRLVNTSGVISTIAGNGTGAYSGDGGMATAAELNYPRGVCFAGGSLFIADEGNNRIRVVKSSGIISTIAGNGIAGYSGDGGLATSADLSSPTGIAFDVSGNMYIADFVNNRIRKVTNVVNSIDQASLNRGPVNLYPNPNKGTFVVETNESQKQTLSVCDVNGKIVLSQVINGTSTIEAGTLNAGVYTINITGNERCVNKKLVIVK